MNSDIQKRQCAPSVARRLTDLFLELLPVRLVKFSAEGLRCEPGVVVKSSGRLRLGKNVVLQRGCLLHCGGRDWSDYKGSIDLGDHVVVGPHCVLYGAGTITVGTHTHFGPGSMVMAQSGDPDSMNRQSNRPGHVNEPVAIGKGVWIGAGAVILGGTTLGDNCTVGPNSVVAGHFEPGTTVIGNPGRSARRQNQSNQRN
jgi:acetyltransferase-like isoleucine patch superfamily enzyme